MSYCRKCNKEYDKYEDGNQYFCGFCLYVTEQEFLEKNTPSSDRCPVCSSINYIQGIYSEVCNECGYSQGY